MSRKETLSQILSSGVIAVIRMKDTRQLLKVIEAIRVGGVKCIEITMTVPGAMDIISQISRSSPSDIIIGGRDGH
jgi:2-dehydro-3-deoxyphosphogluconate aldolase/(4S)-4-hydroxy-2-oxoglutarate aldolase